MLLANCSSDAKSKRRSIHGSLPPPRALGAPPQTSSSGSVTRLSLDLNRQPQIQAHEAVQLPASFPRCSPDGALPNMWIQGGNPGGSLPHAAFDPAAGKHSMPAWINKSNASVLCEPQQCIRAWFFLRPDLPFFSCVLRGGPVFTERFVRARTTYPQLDRRNIGFGLGLSVCLQRRYRKRVNMEIFVVYTSLFRRIRLATSWNLDCQRIVPQQAVVFQYVRNGSLDGVKRLLGSGQASARDITVHGITLLHTASNLGNCELVRFLIEAGADVNAPDEDGETPLHRAMSMRNNYETAKILIENGADLANVAVGSRTPLHTIFNDTMGKVLTSEDWIEDMGPDSDGMSITHLLAWSSQTTPEVFERGRARDTIDLWSADHSGRTCLHFAASRGNLGLLKYLLDRASPFEIQQRDLFGHAVVHYAVRSSRMIATLELLVAKGAKMYATDSNNQNMLHHAAKWRQLEDIQQLLALDHKGSFLSPDKDGQLPSQCAHKRNSSEVYLYLRRLESAKRCTEETSKWQICQISRNKIVSMRFHYNPSTNPRLFMAWQMWAKALKALHKTLFARSYKKSFVLMIFVSLLLMMSLVPRTRGLSGIPA